MLAMAACTQCDTETCGEENTAMSNRGRKRRLKRLKKLRAKQRRKRKARVHEVVTADEKNQGNTVVAESVECCVEFTKYSDMSLADCTGVRSVTFEKAELLMDKSRVPESNVQSRRTKSADKVCDTGNSQVCNHGNQSVCESNACKQSACSQCSSCVPTDTCTTSSHTSQSCAPSDGRLQSAKLPGPECYVALDCEFVGVGPGKISALGRCSVVDYDGRVVLDLYVMPEEPITDYRTPWSGIRRQDMRRAVPLHSAVHTIRKVIQGKIIVGHAVFNDFRVLRYRHPPHLVRDTHAYRPLRQRAGFSAKSGVSLKRLALSLLGMHIQGSHGHCSVEDARSTMSLFRLVRLEWEQALVDSAPAQRSRRSGVANRGLELANGEPAVMGRQRTNSFQASFSESEESFLQDSFWPSDVGH